MSWTWQFEDVSGVVIASGAVVLREFYEEDKPWSVTITSSTGVLKFYDENKRLRETHDYKNGLLNGSLMIWDASGRMRQYGAYLAGKEHGAFVLWHEDGGLLSINVYEDGLESGLYQSWYPNGKRQSSAWSSAGRSHGHQYQWTENGVLFVDAEWRYGMPWDGRVVAWQQIGAYPVMDIYKNGILLAREQNNRKLDIVESNCSTESYDPTAIFGSWARHIRDDEGNTLFDFYDFSPSGHYRITRSIYFGTNAVESKAQLFTGRLFVPSKKTISFVTGEGVEFVRKYEIHDEQLIIATSAEENVVLTRVENVNTPF